MLGKKFFVSPLLMLAGCNHLVQNNVGVAPPLSPDPHIALAKTPTLNVDRQSVLNGLLMALKSGDDHQPHLWTDSVTKEMLGHVLNGTSVLRAIDPTVVPGAIPVALANDLANDAEDVADAADAILLDLARKLTYAAPVAPAPNHADGALYSACYVAVCASVVRAAAVRVRPIARHAFDAAHVAVGRARAAALFAASLVHLIAAFDAEARARAAALSAAAGGTVAAAAVVAAVAAYAAVGRARARAVAACAYLAELFGAADLASAVLLVADAAAARTDFYLRAAELFVDVERACIAAGCARAAELFVDVERACIAVAAARTRAAALFVDAERACIAVGRGRARAVLDAITTVHAAHTAHAKALGVIYDETVSIGSKNLVENYLEKFRKN